MRMFAVVGSFASALGRRSPLMAQFRGIVRGIPVFFEGGRVVSSRIRCSACGGSRFSPLAGVGGGRIFAGEFAVFAFE